MFDYDFDEKNLKNLKNEKDVITLLMNHSFESFVFSVRTGEFNYALAREMGFDKAKSEIYFLCGLYHDVGKIGMSKFLIDFPGRYNEVMREQMKKHTEGGGYLLEMANAQKYLSETAKYHHCNYDGTGYIKDLAGEDIPLHARMTRISDSADAYLSSRTYKEGYQVEGLYADLEQYSGTWYDPNLLKYLKTIHENVLSKATKDPKKMNQDEYMYILKKIYEIDDIASEYLFSIIRNEGK